jgi:hypothetical protein
MDWLIIGFGILITFVLLVGLRMFYTRNKILDKRKELKQKKNRYRTEEEFINYPND